MAFGELNLYSSSSVAVTLTSFLTSFVILTPAMRRILKIQLGFPVTLRELNLHSSSLFAVTLTSSLANSTFTASDMDTGITLWFFDGLIFSFTFSPLLYRQYVDQRHRGFFGRLPELMMRHRQTTLLFLFWVGGSMPSLEFDNIRKHTMPPNI